MKKISTLVGIIIIVAVAIIAFGGVFAYQYYFRKTPDSQLQIPGKDYGVKNNTAQTITLCSTKIRATVNQVKNNPNMDWLSLRYVSAQFFDNATAASDYLFSQGFNNPAGHGALDIGEAPPSTRNLIIAIVALGSDFNNSTNGQTVFMEATQPIVCINGNIADNSRLFLTEGLLDPTSTRFNIYYKGKVVNR